MGILVGDVKCVTLVVATIACDRGTRLDGIRNHPVVDEIEPCNVSGLRKRGVGGVLVPDRPGEADVVGRHVVERRCVLFDGVDRAHHSRQDVVIDLDHLGGILRLRDAFRDDHGDRIPDVTHLTLREHGMRRLLHRLSIRAGDQPTAR